MKIKSIERENLKPGDVLLCPPVSLPKGWIGQTIVALTEGRVSHAALYYGEIDGIKQVAHSDLKGIRFQPIDEFLEESPGCYVARLDGNSNINLDYVLKAAEGYIKEENKYPLTNFIFLGLLILTNHMPVKKLHEKFFYSLIVKTSLVLMKNIKEKAFSKNAMTCSQFVTQCFTDTKNKATNIEFQKLIIQVNSSNSTNGSTSLLNLLMDTDSVDNTDLSESMANDNSTLEMEMEETAAQFVLWMNDEGTENLSNSFVDKIMLANESEKLLNTLCKIITGKTPKNKKDAFRLLSEADRNYFVLPDDLFSNTKNLKNMGYVLGYP